MKKSLFLMAILGLAMTSCSNEEYLGDDANLSKNQAINFNSAASVVSRATDATAAANALEKYVDNFKVYGVKTVGTATSDVFKNYTVSFTKGSAGSAASNTHDWDYVSGNQTIKYWDYSATQYKFWAVAPAANATFTVASNAVTEAVITGVTPSVTVFVANPTVVAKANFNKVVALNFKHLQAQVRVGMYETVPGYKVSGVKFYTQAGTDATVANLIGEKFATSADYKVTFDNTLNTFSTAINGTPSTEKDLKFASAITGDLAETSAAASLVAYNSVLPTAAGNLSIKVDYTLTSTDGSGEVINVKGATATIPAALTDWKANHSYTYIFKISDQTNGTTGDPGTTDPAGLFPITFDGVVDNFDITPEGSITTVSEPSITTFQAGSAIATGVKYVAGTAIDVYVMEGTTPVTFSETKKLTITGPADFNQETTSGTKATIATPVKGSYTVSYTNGTTTVTKVITVEEAPVAPSPARRK